nr:hypothetical protein BaRGS_028894 [Batillaria attramentaria]
MRKRPILFQDYHSAGYNCANLDMGLNEFYLDNQACLLSHNVIVANIVVFTVIIGCITSVSLLFAFRWHLRLKLYELCRGRDRRHWANRRVRRFQYDLFVSYAEEDMGWVRGELLPLLEDQWGLKLCVHHRDFIPGKHIIDNISYCVEESERILMVFSSHFAASHWCQFELKMCQTCVMDRDDVLVLVTIGNTASYELTGAMLAVISTTTYLEWEANCEDRRPFWTRLRIALDDIFTNAQTADLRDDVMIMA